MSWQIIILINAAVISSFILGVICGFIALRFLLKEAQNQNQLRVRAQENQDLINFEMRVFEKMKRRFKKNIREDWPSISN